MKTLVDNVYYYQDELGSTSHVADANGAVLEYYRYDLYGTPLCFSSTSQQLTSSTYGVRDLGDGGARWMPELGLYDDRNRFMSPDLGRFLQPDPIGFKGDSSNLYRYVGNDWANRTDPMGLEGGDAIGNPTAPPTPYVPPGAMNWDFDKRADTSGGNGTNDGRAAQPKDAEAKDAPQNKLQGTNPNLQIPSQTYPTGFAAAKPQMDKAYDEVRGMSPEKRIEMTGPIGQVDGVTKGGYFAGQYAAGEGKIKPGQPHAGDQGSNIAQLTAGLPKGSHLVGYYTVHIHHDPSKMRNPDAGIFQTKFGIQPKIWMVSPGRGGPGGDWERRAYDPYPNTW